ncbi:MAG: pyridoxamine 5'-phosphate oxidase family protein [Oscillospiraceae bacterium]
MTNDFSEITKLLWNKIGTHGVMTLSTCADNRVTSRSMSVVVIDGKFYCQTNENYLKYKQISKNPNVALCFDNFSVEGVCRNIGKPLEHDFFISAMKASFANAVERWSALPSECVLEITPKLIYSWVYEDNKPFMEYWDLDSMTYRKERQ